MDVVVDADAWAELRAKGCVDNTHRLTDLGRLARKRLDRLGFHVTSATEPEESPEQDGT